MKKPLTQEELDAIRGGSFGGFRLEAQDDWHPCGDEVDDGESNMTVVCARTANGDFSGSVEFVHQKGRLRACNLEVSIKRSGVGTFMYVFAESVTGMTAVPHEEQSIEGQAFWSQPNRPFGR